MSSHQLLTAQQVGECLSITFVQKKPVGVTTVAILCNKELSGPRNQATPPPNTHYQCGSLSGSSYPNMVPQARGTHVNTR